MWRQLLLFLLNWNHILVIMVFSGVFSLAMFHSLITLCGLYHVHHDDILKSQLSQICDKLTALLAEYMSPIVQHMMTKSLQSASNRLPDLLNLRNTTFWSCTVVNVGELLSSMLQTTSTALLLTLHRNIHVLFHHIDNKDNFCYDKGSIPLLALHNRDQVCIWEMPSGAT